MLQGIIPDGSIIFAGALFLVTAICLNLILFKPLARVLAQRDAQTTGLRGEAQALLKEYDDSFEDYRREIKAERQRGYKLAEATRKDSLKDREKMLSDARAQADGFKEKAKGELEGELDSARDSLHREAESISRLITTRVLGRETA